MDYDLFTQRLALVARLAAITGRRVDLIPEHELNRHLERYVLTEAVLRNLQTLSKATQHLPDGLKASHAEVPWQQISGFRNILVHSYLGEIDPETVLRVVKE